MERVGLCLPAVVAARLVSDLVRHGHAVTGTYSDAAELAESLGEGGTDVAIVAGQPRYLDDRLVTAADADGVRIVALVESEADRRYATALGLYEVVDVDAPFASVEASMARSELAAPTPPQAVDPADSERRGTVIAVWGPQGAPGRTAIAITLAAELAARGRSVVLADVDTHGGAVAPSLGLLDESPGFAAACRLAATGSLNLTELDRIAEHYSSSNGSFRVLTGIARSDRWPELSSERVTATIVECRRWADFVLLDTGASLESDEEISSDLFAPHRNAATITAIREADVVVAVGSADPVGFSRFLRANSDLVELVRTDRMIVVMNRVRASAIGLNPSAQVTSTLERFGGIRSPVLVPHDQPAFDAAILAGRTLVDAAPRSPARLAVAAMVTERILPPEPAARAARGRRRTTSASR